MIMAPIPVVLTLAAVWLVYLVVERVLLDLHRRAVPLRIAVTGTRGKTTVTRRLAAVLGEDGRRVLAKTTGSEAAYLFPDGSTREIPRLGPPSIIEQKRLIKKGAKLGVDVVLAEVMSLHPENHRVEVHRILQPQLVLVTNFRVDHIEAHGGTRGEVASVMALDVPPGARALVPESEWEESFQELVNRGGGGVVRVPTGEGRAPGGCAEFGSNLDLVWAAARSLGVKDEVILRGLCNAQEDVGALRSWRYSHGNSGEPWMLVNAFAANDPESTLGIYDRIAESQGIPPESCIGLLSLRPDRGDRSLQWAEALRAGALAGFRRLFLAGLHAHAVRHRLRHHAEADRIEILRPDHPEGTMIQILGGEEGGGMLFGFGNIAGLGRSLVDHWRKVGEPYGI
jgi:poly-gamma-glutamate synthase PgsB/CapB